jgi:hypothetical protein
LNPAVFSRLINGNLIFVAQMICMTAQQKPRQYPKISSATSRDATGDISQALHPMHVELARRMSGGAVAEEQAWSRPAKMAFMFYAGLASWASVGLAIYLATRIF